MLFMMLYLGLVSGGEDGGCVVCWVHFIHQAMARRPQRVGLLLRQEPRYRHTPITLELRTYTNPTSSRHFIHPSIHPFSNSFNQPFMKLCIFKIICHCYYLYRYNHTWHKTVQWSALPERVVPGWGGLVVVSPCPYCCCWREWLFGCHRFLLSRVTFFPLLPLWCRNFGRVYGIREGFLCSFINVFIWFLSYLHPANSITACHI